jgi:hypothetical protein
MLACEMRMRRLGNSYFIWEILVKSIVCFRVQKKLNLRNLVMVRPILVDNYYNRVGIYRGNT